MIIQNDAATQARGLKVCWLFCVLLGLWVWNRLAWKRDGSRGTKSRVLGEPGGPAGPVWTSGGILRRPPNASHVALSTFPSEPSTLRLSYMCTRDIRRERRNLKTQLVRQTGGSVQEDKAHYQSAGGGGVYSPWGFILQRIKARSICFFSTLT